MEGLPIPVFLLEKSQGQSSLVGYRPWGLKELEKTLESPLNCKEIQSVHPKGNQSWVFNGRTDVEAEIPVLWPPIGRAGSFEKTLMLEGIGGMRRRG